MKRSITAVTLSLFMLSAPAVVTGGEIGLAGIEVGISSCATIVDLPQGEAAILRGRRDAVTRGVAFDLAKGAFGLPWVYGGHISCDPALHTVEAITIDIGAADFAKIVAALENRYRETEKVVPVVGDRRAVFVSDSGETIAVVSDPHLDEAELSLQTAAYHEYLSMREASARTAIEGFGPAGDGG